MRNEPAKRRLDCDELDAMEKTCAEAPERPPNGGADHEDEPTFHTATSDAGELKFPPTHTCLFSESQYTALIAPLGPPEPSADIAPDDELYDAMFCAPVLAKEENAPATKKVLSRAQPEDIEPPAFVEPMRDKEPSDERERSVEDVGSRERDEDELAQSSPANAPTRPTLPIRS